MIKLYSDFENKRTAISTSLIKSSTCDKTSSFEAALTFFQVSSLDQFSLQHDLLRLNFGKSEPKIAYRADMFIHHHNTSSTPLYR